MDKQQILQIEDILRDSLRHKFKNYHPETSSMPFHTRLLGKDRMALFSFIHSLNTNFGTAIFEPVAVALAKTRFYNVKSQVIAGTNISESAQKVIQEIIDALRTTESKPNKMQEIEAIRAVCQTGCMKTVKHTNVDLWLESDSGAILLFDLKTAKPNKGGFIEFKRTLLEWAACILANNPNAQIATCVAIPYNPYAPKQYSRWTMAGMLDFEHELKVAEEFWDFLGGKGAYDKLLDIFEYVGLELRDEIDQYFARYNH